MASISWGPLSTNNWLQKLTLVGAVLISALMILAAPAFLYSSEQPAEENRIVVPPLAYETHLPKEIYEICLIQHLLEIDEPTNLTILQNSDGTHRLFVSFNDEKGMQYIAITYLSEKVINNMRGIQVVYRMGALMGYVVFDEQETRYVFQSPFSSNEEVLEVTQYMLDKVFPLFQE